MDSKPVESLYLVPHALRSEETSVAHGIDVNTIFPLIDQRLQTPLDFRKARAREVAFKDAVLHSLAKILERIHNFCTAAVGFNIVRNYIVHGWGFR